MAFGGVSDSQQKDANPDMKSGMRKRASVGTKTAKQDPNLWEATVSPGLRVDFGNRDIIAVGSVSRLGSRAGGHG